MSLFTEAKKTKSLWHPITDEDFNIDFSKPVIFLTDEGGLFLVNDVSDMRGTADDETFWQAQSLTEEGKDWFRNSYYAYMYVDEAFFKAVEPSEKENTPHYHSVAEVKGTAERPYLFTMFENGEMRVNDHFDFSMNGTFERSYAPLRNNNEGYIEPVPIKYVVNLNHCLQTSIDAIFLQSTVFPTKAYIVTAGEYSDYRIEGVFTDKKLAEFFAVKDNDYRIEEYTADNIKLLSEERLYGVKVYVGKSEGKVKVKSLFDYGEKSLCDVVKYYKWDEHKEYIRFVLRAINQEKAKAIALERYHALLAVEQTHFPLLRWLRGDSSWRYAFGKTSLVFGYFDYQAYFTEFSYEKVQDLFAKVKDYLPIKFTVEEEKYIPWTNLTKEYCLKAMKKHGLNVKIVDFDINLS